MNKIFTLVLAFIFLLSFQLAAQEIQGFDSLTRITRIPVTKNTGEKPQSKVWNYACKQWTVLPDPMGTHLWRLDGTAWTKVMTLSSNTLTKADCKVVNDVAHILLFEEITPPTKGSDTTASKNSKASLVSLEHIPAINSYKRWSKRPPTVDITLVEGSETATIDIDGEGRMWLASNGGRKVNVWWSDAPYSDWGKPVVLAKELKNDDICAVVTLPGKMGVFWSNQNTKRFGFKTHRDGADPSDWSNDEVPAASSALNVGTGMADDHMNFAVAKDGTLYCAIKTSYETPGYPLVGLLVRSPSGAWDKLYEVSDFGTRPIVILDETQNKLRVIYSAVEDGGDILYKETSLSNISFGPQLTLLSGKFDNASSSKDNFTSEVVIIVSSNTHAIGVLASNGTEPPVCATPEPRMWSLTAFPNPFSDKTTIYFILPEGGDYTLSLFDSKGAKVSDIKQETAIAGELNSVELPGTLIARGLYLVRLQANGSIKSVKLVYER